MLVMRLFRVGKKNQPAFKIVVTDKSRPPRGGRFVEEVGFYNPLTKEKVLKKERIKYWLSVGIKPSITIHNLLISEKILEGERIAKHKKEKPSKSTEESLKPAKAISKPDESISKSAEDLTPKKTEK